MIGNAIFSETINGSVFLIKVTVLHQYTVIDGNDSYVASASASADRLCSNSPSITDDDCRARSLISPRSPENTYLFRD